MRWLIYFILFFAVNACSDGPVDAEVNTDSNTEIIIDQKIDWHWEDEFSEDEKVKMTNWITFVSDCAQRVLGRYPFDLHYYFHRESDSKHAVVFGHTERSQGSHGAHFYVNPTYPVEDFMDDWIGPHEICHLALPKLGKSNAWFFEGFATYMSRKVMVEMGVITAEEADSTYRERLSFIKPSFESNSNFIAVGDSLRGQRGYTQLYWGGGSYFYKADQQLSAANKSSTIDVLKEFQKCCHRFDMSLSDVIKSFDEISETTIFSDLEKDYRHLPAREILKEFE